MSDDDIQTMFDQRDRAEPADADRIDQLIDSALRRQFMERRRGQRAEVDALDAARYRWLRREEEPNGAEPFICRRAHGTVFTRWTGKEADAAVDSTIALHDMNKDE